MKAIRTRKREAGPHSRSNFNTRNTVTTEIYVETEQTVARDSAPDPPKFPIAWNFEDPSTGSDLAPYSVTTHITSDRAPIQREPDSDDDHEDEQDAESDMIELTTRSILPRTASPSGRKNLQGGAIVETRPVAVREAPNATWRYAKCAMLFFVALLVTYVPSTASRIHGLVYPGQVQPGLVYASVFVLPLQGFWNFLIYVYTNRRACRLLRRRLFHKIQRNPKDRTVTRQHQQLSSSAHKGVKLGGTEDSNRRSSRVVP